jgi:hypothetical protein
MPGTQHDAERLTRSTNEARDRRLQLERVFEAYGISCDQLRAAVDEFSEKCRKGLVKKAHGG